MIKKITLKNVVLDESHILSKEERASLVGGEVTGVRYYEGSCYCDYGPGMCDLPCSAYHCAMVGMDVPF